jgi:hypothetical protein
MKVPSKRSQVHASRTKVRAKRHTDKFLLPKRRTAENSNPVARADGTFLGSCREQQISSPASWSQVQVHDLRRQPLGSPFSDNDRLLVFFAANS